MLNVLKKYQIVLAVAAFILKNGKLLVVKKSPQEKIDAGKWVVPGGKINPDELIYQGLKREIKEEVNLDIVNYHWVNENVFLSNNYYFHAQHFICKVKSFKNLRLEKDLIDYTFITKKNLKKYNIPKGLLETMKIIL